MSSHHPPLDRWRFDAIASGPEKLWGLEEIARALGVSIDTARRWARRADVPIYKPAGRYFAVRSELNAWLRQR
ncbi:helix-turn-helix domain-containing protein [Tranquillimonas alkanivorans]|uniref:DNA binding domain-containing protein, excisionase family n=1 Tax=Tranquillimonas alkanivorans TaxID=441119 RepID=A0A1I5RWT4_9RHOB|nr:helix-turn-helix domain-containing protein [Tranquillimonas alkanivorans]SFP62999.1 DNA binding domain-containing protein, excisionase family [Tranquillimonas alkanivorans]